MAEIKIVENTSEIGAGTRGAGLGIGALHVVSRSRGDHFFNRYERFLVSDQNDLLDEPTDFSFAKRIDGLEMVYRETMDIMDHILSAGNFPLVLSGDHSCAAGTIAGIKKAHPKKRLGVIWIDAHGDLHTPYTTPSGNMHGMPLAISLGEDNRESGKNTPDENAVVMWNRLKELGGVIPKVLPQDLKFIALRDTEKPEDEFIARKNIKNYAVAEVRERSARTIANEIKEALAACDIVYISFDVDSMDSDLVSEGTGTPVKKGLTPEDAKTFLTEFSNWDKTCCIEMVEINPCLDNKINRMAEVAYDILTTTAGIIEKRI